MAAKKTSAQDKSTKAAKGAQPSPSESRPLATCPFPDHLRVELESAQAEVLAGLVAPDAPRPVFSTRALEHGTNAAGAASVREGFSWNRQMDLAWALGYPAMTFIVDGVPGEDTKNGLLAFYGRTLKQLETASWYNSTASVFPRLVPRRAAFALLDELDQGDHAFELSDDEFLDVTAPRDLSQEEVRKFLETVDEPLWLERIALLLEALAGSSVVAQVLCDMLEARASDEGKNARFRVEINDLLMAIGRRLPPAEAAALQERGAPDARARGLESFNNGRFSLALARLQWADGVEDEVLRAFIEDCKTRVGDVPFPRYLFAGGENLVKEQVALFDKYMDGPRVFFAEYSTIKHPLLTGPALLARAHKDYREGMTSWLGKHTDFFRPHLENLTSDAKLGRHAADVLKRLG